MEFPTTLQYWSGRGRKVIFITRPHRRRRWCRLKIKSSGRLLSDLIKRKCHAFHIHKLSNILDCEIWANLISSRDIWLWVSSLRCKLRRNKLRTRQYSCSPEWIFFFHTKTVFLFYSQLLSAMRMKIAFVFALNAHERMTGWKGKGGWLGDGVLSSRKHYKYSLVWYGWATISYLIKVNDCRKRFMTRQLPPFFAAHITHSMKTKPRL